MYNFFFFTLTRSNKDALGRKGRKKKGNQYFVGHVIKISLHFFFF